MNAEDLRFGVEPEPAKPIRQGFELFSRVMPFKGQYAHLQQLRIRASGQDFPFRTFYVHLDEIEAIYTRKAGNIVPVDAFNYLGMIVGAAQRILDLTALETEVAGAGRR
jgi:hypothetical protein